MSCPSVDQASKQNFIVNIQHSELGKLVVRWRERDTCVPFLHFARQDRQDENKNNEKVNKLLCNIILLIIS